MKRDKDVYEHLANVYLDSSGPNKKRIRTPGAKSLLLKNLFKIGVAVFICVVIVLTVTIFKQKPISKGQLSLILEDNPTKLNYNFNQSEKETVIFDLKNMNLQNYKILGFRVRKGNYRDNLHMCVEFISDFEEKSQFYIKHIPTSWRNYKIELNEFKDISNWSRMRQLLFILEEWNCQDKQGTVYIDNICFLN